MQEKSFLKEIYRDYFEHRGNSYLFVVVDADKRILGRLYDTSGLIPDFELEVNNSVRTALSSHSPVNPFSEYQKAAQEFLDGRRATR